MTLGNNPQPLTRRQLRELAREQEPASAEAAPDAAAVPAPLDSAPLDPGHHSRHTAPAAAAPTADSAAPAAAAAVPAASERTAAPAPLPLPETATDTDPGRTLTRRELRALHAAASASVLTDPVDDSAAAQDQSVPAPGHVSATRAAGTVESGHTPSGHTPSGLNPPLGHWSVDDHNDGHTLEIGRREDRTFEDFVGHGIGAGGSPTTTNALILPAIPRQGTGGPITSTGEIMITGSIDLPRSLGATGQLPNLFDSSEMDRMLDQLDEGGHHHDVAPVSASRAVSTHTSTRGVMTPPRKRGASLPTVLAVTAAVLAIGVLSLFVIGYAFHIY